MKIKEEQNIWYISCDSYNNTRDSHNPLTQFNSQIIIKYPQNATYSLLLDLVDGNIGAGKASRAGLTSRGCTGHSNGSGGCSLDAHTYGRIW